MKQTEIINTHEQIGATHPFRAHCDEMASMTQSIRKTFSLVSFTFWRCYWNGKYISLCDHRKISDTYWEHKLYNKHITGIGFVNKHPLSMLRNVYKQMKNNADRSLEALKQAGNFSNMLIHMKHYFGYSELYFLCHNDDAAVFKTKLKRHKHLFNRHVQKFKADARSLIKEARRFAAPIPAFNVSSSDRVEEPLINPVAPIKRYVLDGEYEDIQLSHAQLNCLFYLVQGLKYEDIATKVFLSRRTVENHINTVRFKLSCENKKSLIEKIKSSRYLMSLIKETQLFSNENDEGDVAEHEVFSDSLEVYSDPFYFDKDSEQFSRVKAKAEEWDLVKVE